jgi:hypothetical protein
MTEPLWRGMKQAKDGAIDDLMTRIEDLVTQGQVTDLESLITDLEELILAVKTLLSKIQGSKTLMGQKGGIEDAMATMRARVEAARKRGGEKKRVPEQIAEKISGQLG